MNGTEYKEALEQWHSDYPLRGIALFEALPDEFSFDQLMHVADLLEIPSLEVVEHLRIMQRERFISIFGSRFFKTKAVATV